MLARLILLLVQLGVGWFAAPHILRYLPKFGGNLDIFIYAIVVALLVTVVAVSYTHLTLPTTPYV